MPAKKVLLTGMSGFLGGHIARELLTQGFHVMGSVRKISDADAVRAYLEASGANVGSLEFCELDLRSDAQWKDAATGCHYLQHVASPFPLTMPSDEAELIEPAVAGTRRAVAAALGAGHGRIVLTSSLAAIDGGHTSYERPFGPSDWTRLDGPDVNAYAKSKTLAEREAWSLAEAADACGHLSVINPGTMLGPLLGKRVSASGQVIQRLLRGEMPMVPRLILPYVDVRDVAAAHVAALTAPEAAGRRHIVTGPAVSMMDIADLLRARFPSRAGKLPKWALPGWMAALLATFDKSLRDNRAYLGVERRYDNSSGMALLGRPLRTTDEAVAAMGQSLFDRGLA
jgi:dihydroflavonol-4-reductase